MFDLAFLPRNRATSAELFRRFFIQHHRQNGPLAQLGLSLNDFANLEPAECFREIGLYDRTWFPHYHADSELVLRAARRGWNILADLHALIWNDEPNTCRAKHPFSLRSAVYWRPMLAIHLWLASGA